MYIINNYLPIWPGGKNKSDSSINSLIGDNIGAIIGWYTAYLLDIYGEKQGWFRSHIRN